MSLGPDPCVLAIELSTSRGSVAVVRGDDVLFEALFESKRSHNAQLFAPLAQALKVAGEQLSRMVVGTGPGSYTGVRIAIAAAQGLGLSRSIPVVGMSSLLGATDLNDFAVVGDARRQQLYVVRVVEGCLQLPISVFPAAQWGEMENGLSHGGPWLCCDPVLPQAETAKDVVLAQPTARLLGLRAVRAGGDLGPVSSSSLEPLYLQDAFITLPKSR